MPRLALELLFRAGMNRRRRSTKPPALGLVGALIAWSASSSGAPAWDRWAKTVHESFVEPGFTHTERALAPLPHLAQMSYVHSALDFGIHSLAHIERVALLVEFAFESIAELKNVLDPRFAGHLIRTHHDHEKLDLSLTFMTQVGWTHSSHPLWHLLTIYGQKATDRTPIDELNRVGELLRTEVLGAFGLIDDLGVSPLGELYLRIEHVADVVDGVAAPERAEEFGHSERAPLRSETLDTVLRQYLGKEEDRAWAQLLISQYESVTSAARYERARSEVLKSLGAQALSLQVCEATLNVPATKHHK